MRREIVISHIVGTMGTVFWSTYAVLAYYVPAVSTLKVWLNAPDAPGPEEFVAYCKKAIGQRLKFSKYPSQPFDLDGEGLFAEGEAGIKEWEEFIMTNRDEDPENITDLRKEAYTGVPPMYYMQGNVLWR